MLLCTRLFAAFFGVVCSLSAFAASLPMPKVGDLAPDFSLIGNKGEAVTLSQFKNKKTVVLYFYPKDRTPGCTTEAESFTEDFERFEKAGAVVLGVSLDDVEQHKSFVSRSKLKHTLLADIGGKVASSYGVMGWIMAKRVTFVIGLDGLVKHVFNDVNVTDHSKAVLKVVQALNGPVSTQNP